MYIYKLLLCKILHIALFINFFFRRCNWVLSLCFTRLNLYFGFSFHYIKHRLFIFFLIFLFDRFLDRYVFNLFPTIKIRYDIVCSLEVEMIINIIGLWIKDRNWYPLQNIFFRIKITTRFNQILMIRCELLFLSFFKE